MTIRGSLNVVNQFLILNASINGLLWKIAQALP